MVHKTYCKINEYHASFVLLNRYLLTKDQQNPTNLSRIKTELAEVWPAAEEHIHCFDKAESKLPNWFGKGCVFARVPFEQCTSEAVAEYHASIFTPRRILSITGGLGVDDAAFAGAGHQVTSLEPDQCLNELFSYNCSQLGLTNIRRLTATAEDFLAGNTKSFDLVYADPDRRPDGKRAAGRADLHTPDVFELMRLYPTLAEAWMIKFSPLTDISWVINHCPRPADITVVEYRGEVREVLALITPDSGGKIRFAFISESGISQFDGLPKPSVADEIGFFVPSPGVIKTGWHRQLAAQGWVSENQNHTFFTGALNLPAEFGRSFRLEKKISGSVNDILRELKTAGIEKANISCRDFVMKTEELRKKSGLADGGDVYLFFTGKKDKHCFVCRKK